MSEDEERDAQHDRTGLLYLIVGALLALAVYYSFR
jgi:hypothetical protein